MARYRDWVGLHLAVVLAGGGRRRVDPGGGGYCALALSAAVRLRSAWRNWTSELLA